MSDKSVTLSRRRVLSMIVVIGLASAALGVGTFAFFTDTETSTDNTVNAGTLNLSGVSDAQITISDAVPSDTVSGNVTANYAGSVPGEIDVNFTLAEPSELSENNAAINDDLTAAEFASELELNNATVSFGGNTTDLTVGLNDSNNNTYADLEDLAAAGTFDNVTGWPASSGDTVTVDLDMTFRSDAGNAAQADGVNATIEIIAQQPEADS